MLGCGWQAGAQVAGDVEVRKSSASAYSPNAERHVGVRAGDARQDRRRDGRERDRPRRGARRRRRAVRDQQLVAVYAADWVEPGVHISTRAARRARPGGVQEGGRADPALHRRPPGRDRIRAAASRTRTRPRTCARRCARRSRSTTCPTCTTSCSAAPRAAPRRSRCRASSTTSGSAISSPRSARSSIARRASLGSGASCRPTGSPKTFNP